MALTLYTNTQSRGVVVDWLILDLGIEVERIEVAYGTEMKSPEFLKLNPFGKVPVLVDGDVVIYELDAICAYLADKFSEKGLAPALNDPKRGLYYRWLFFGAGPFAAAWQHAGLPLRLGRRSPAGPGCRTRRPGGVCRPGRRAGLRHSRRPGRRTAGAGGLHPASRQGPHPPCP